MFFGSTSSTYTIVRLKPLKIPAVYSVHPAETGKPVGADTIRPPVTGGTKHDGKANTDAWLPL